MNIEKILEYQNITPILMDIGAAGDSPAIWKPLAASSMLIGFEPDERNLDPTFGANFKKALLVNKVVSASEQDEVDFILTKYPSCSSTLEPDLKALGSFVFQDLFEPVERIKLPSTSLNSVFKKNDLAGANWIKVDAQGADLKILRSISAEYASQLLVVDIEPGFIDAYIDEDLYPACHAWLKDEGFWLCDLKYQSYAKIRPQTMNALETAGFDRAAMLARLTKSPTAAEARYLREVKWFETQNPGKGVWILGMVFGFANDQLGYVFDLLDVYDEQFGVDEPSVAVREMSMKALKKLLG